MGYETKPMKMQWREIDGRQVPFVLPQYWDTSKKDWVVTSEQDRLPVDARLIGGRVVETIHSREVRNSNASKWRHPVPDWARGYVLLLTIHSISGDFSGGDGVRLDHSIRSFESSAPSNSLFRFRSDYFNVPGYFIFSNFAAEIDVEGFNTITGVNRLGNVHVRFMPTPEITINLDFSGTFSEGEGADSEVTIMWLR